MTFEFLANATVWLSNSLHEAASMNYHTAALRSYRMHKNIIHHTIIIGFLFIILMWLLVKGYILQLARRARDSFETSPESRADQITNQFDEALQVSFRKATWELIQDNVGVYALQGRRANMEDRFNLVNRLDHTDTSLYGVFDGHGGEFSSEYTEKAIFKKIITKLLDKSLSSADVSQTEYDDADVCEILKSSTLEVDQSLLSILKSAHDTSGTTALIAVVRKEKLYVANVGDSRGVMCDHQLTPIPLSYDHKPDSPDERARIEKTGGFVSFFGVWRVNGILATSRALGDYSLKFQDEVIAEPDVRVFDLTEHRPLFMILATDGLWDVFSNAEAVQFIHNHMAEPDFGAKSLVQEAFTKGSLDNISAIVVNFAAKPAQTDREKSVDG